VSQPWRERICKNLIIDSLALKELDGNYETVLNGKAGFHLGLGNVPQTLIIA